MNKSCLLFVVAWAGLVFCPVARAQFGQVDPGFRQPEFNRTVLPVRVISDRNASHLSERLEALGFEMRRTLMVGDPLEDIESAVRSLTL